jgi:gingipain R
MLMGLCLAAGAAERMELASGDADVTATVLESGQQRVVVRFDVHAFERNTVSISGQTYFTLSCHREGGLLNAGEPALPRICRSVIIPDDAEMELEILDATYRDFPATRVAPSKGNLLRTVNPADVPYTFGSVYKGKEWYPERLADLREPYILRDLRGTVIELNAFRYLPSEELLRVYTSITVAVKVAGPGRVNVLRRREPLTAVDPAFDMLYRRHFLNYGLDETTRYSPVLEDGEMLIITADSFRTAMQPFVSWKIQKGIKTTMVNVSTVGNNSTSIRNYIQNFFTSSGGNLTYVLLVGDAAQVATPMSPDSAADPTYAKVAGGDNYPDIFIGRFSAQLIAQVNTQVERSVEYERDAVADAWYSRGTGVASSQGPGHNGGEYDSTHMNYIRADLLAYGYSPVDKIYDPGATAAQVSTALNAGRGIVNYTGHGSATAWTTTGFSNTNVAALTNDNLLPFIFSVACLNGQFASAATTCFGEAWLRSTRSGQPIGALATYMASINQSWDPPMDAQDEFNDLLCAESKTAFGGLCYNASCRMIDLNGSNGAHMFDYWIIFGDPSVQVRTQSPLAMTVGHSSTIAVGATSFALTVSGVQGALCALSRNDTLYGFAYTNASGQATVPVNGSLVAGQTIKLTVTALNKVTYLANITVASASISVVAPNGGEIWLVGDTDTIRWTSANLAENVMIQLNRNYPSASWDTVIASTPNDGSHPWPVTEGTTANARIRIRGTVQTTAADTSDANFTIARRSLAVTDPDGGEMWFVGDTAAITWTSQYLTENVKIELNRDYPNGEWELISPGAPNDGVHSWPISGDPTSEARIRVTGTTHTSVSDTSDADFEIARRTLTVSVPDGGEFWQTDDERMIEWTSSNVPGDVKIELNRGYPGASWENIAASAPNTGSCPWTVTEPATENARVRIISLAYPFVGDTSGGDFGIGPPNLPPSIFHDPLHDQVPGSFTVTAVVTDDRPGFTVQMICHDGGDTVQSFSLSATGHLDEYAATVGSLAEGAYSYYLRAQDMGGDSTLTGVHTFEVRTVSGTEIAYDDGSAEVSHWSEQTGYRWAVKFEPPELPFLLYAARIGISAENPDGRHTPIKVQVLLADGPLGLPGSLMLNKTVGSIGNVIGGVPPEEDGWTRAATRDASGHPLVMTGPFYIAVSNPVWGDYEAFLHDTSSAFAARSFVHDPCDGTWYGEDESDSSARRGNRLIRAVGAALTAPTVVAQVDSGYLHLHWTNTGAPLYKILSATSIGGPYSIELTTNDTTATVARMDTAAARQFYQVVSASE